MSYYDFYLMGFKPITKKDSLKQLKTRIQTNYDEDLNEEIHQVMGVLRTLEGQKFTKRLHSKIYDTSHPRSTKINKHQMVFKYISIFSMLQVSVKIDQNLISFLLQS